MSIRSRKKPTIKAGTTYSYNPEIFHEFERENFKETDDPQEILDNIVPYELAGRKFISIDTETIDLGLPANQLPAHIVRRWVGTGKKAKPQDIPFAFSICDGVNAYTIYDTLENGFAKFKKLSPILGDQSIEKILHNAKFDMHMWHNIGELIRGRIHDTVNLLKIIDENRHNYALVQIARKAKWGITVFEDMVDTYKKTHKITRYNQIPKRLLTQYANADVWNCFNLFLECFPYLETEELVELYETECKLLISTYSMERKGFRIDMDYEVPLKTELQELTDTAEQKIYDAAGRVFNINSTKQLADALVNGGFDPYNFQKTDKGNIKMDKKEVERLLLTYDVPILENIQDFKKYEKLLNTYAIGIYMQADANDRVHGGIRQTEARTGRMSIVKPALQTLPKRDTRIRRAFLPDPGYVLFFMDLDQVEYRLFAHYAKAWGLIELIKGGEDVHTATASLVFDVPMDEVTKEQRDMAKQLNFALIYGMGIDALAAALNKTVQGAIRFREKYFASIPEAEPFIELVKSVVRARGYVKNFFNRRRRLNNNEAYKATNAVIQGCAADYLKVKIVDIYAYLHAMEYKTRMLLPVHDEIAYNFHPDEVHIAGKVRWLMSDFETFRVPITAGIERGCPSWGQKEDCPEIDFEPITAQEREKIDNFDFYDGHVFDNKYYQMSA